MERLRDELRGDRSVINPELMLLNLRFFSAEGQVLAVRQGEKTGLLGTTRQDAKEVNLSEPFFFNLIKAALAVLGME